MSLEQEILAGLTGSLEVEHGLDKKCAEMVEFAKGIAPVFGDLPPKRGEPAHGEPEDYKNSIHTKPMGPGHRRVESDDFKAVWIELGTRHMPEYAVFAKTAAQFGGTGPTIDVGVQQAQHKLRESLETLAKLRAGHAVGAHAIERAKRIAEQKRIVNQARIERTAAFKAARRGRGRRSR